MAPVSTPQPDGSAAAPVPDLDAEYRQAREECALHEPADRVWLEVKGADAAVFLHGQLTNDVENLATGTGCEALLLSRKGRIKAAMRVFRTGENEFLVETAADRLPLVLKHVSMYRIGHNVEIDQVDLEMISVLGPGSAEATGHLPGPEHSFDRITLAGTDCRAIATAGGIDLVCDPGGAAAVRDELRRKHAVPVSNDATEILRVEAGRPRIGFDTGETTMPAEAGLVERTVSFGTGCYIGQEPVVRLAHRGRPNRHLRGLRFHGPAAAGDPVRLGERELGTVGTAVISPAHGRIGLAILRREAEPGAAVTVISDAGETEADVVELPFAGAPL